MAKYLLLLLMMSCSSHAYMASLEHSDRAGYQLKNKMDVPLQCRLRYYNDALNFTLNGNSVSRPFQLPNSITESQISLQCSQIDATKKFKQRIWRVNRFH